MKETQYLTGREVALPMMLEARERRVFLQNRFLKRKNAALISFTMNIPGPVKNNMLIRTCFDFGLRDLLHILASEGIEILEKELLDEVTGPEAFLLVDADALAVKRLTCLLEDNSIAGRLYDMDVIDPGAGKLDRGLLGLEERGCMICKSPGRDCASRRVHSPEELQRTTRDILRKAVRERKSRMAAELAVRALLYEVSATPKPGLVDRRNNGSHRDMDFYSFMNSSAGLWPYFRDCTEKGIETAAAEAPETLRQLRPLGIIAEYDMLTVTGGVNTHKGAIFSLGLLCGAYGRLQGKRIDALPEMLRDETEPAEAILREAAQMCRGITERELASGTSGKPSTIGQELYSSYGISGVRGQAEAGFPAVLEYGLPLMEQLLREGKNPDEVSIPVLLTLIARAEDTNLIHRGSLEVREACAEEAAKLVERMPEDILARAQQLDASYIRRNLSPGGSADLLAICWFLHFLTREEQNL